VSNPENINKGDSAFLRRPLLFYMEISTHQLKVIIQEAAEIGALHALARTGQVKPFLKKNEAYRRFGRYKVERWIEDGLVSIRKDGDHSAAWRIDRLEIEAIASAALLFRYL
jgi:hypothetical protein